MSETIPFEQRAVLGYLDAAVREWRMRRDRASSVAEEDMAAAHIDAFQSVRSSLFGERLPLVSPDHPDGGRRGGE